MADSYWVLQASRNDAPTLEERVHRQGTAYRRARQLYAAGYTVTVLQFSAEEPPAPLGAYHFDGIRFVRLPRIQPRA